MLPCYGSTHTTSFINTDLQWKELLDIPAIDTRTGKAQTTPMLALVLAGETDLLHQLHKVSSHLSPRAPHVLSVTHGCVSSWQAGGRQTSVDEWGRTSLMNAIIHGNDNIATTLIDLGADVNAFDDQVSTKQSQMQCHTSYTSVNSSKQLSFTLYTSRATLFSSSHLYHHTMPS